MKIVEPRVQFFPHSLNPYKTVERVGRLCYKSEDSITPYSYRGFCKRLVDNQHFAMLEHGVMTFSFCADPRQLFELARIPGTEFTVNWLNCWTHITVNLSHLYNPRWEGNSFLETARWFIQNKYDLDIKPAEKLMEIELIENPRLLEENHHFLSMHFEVDRGVSHELVRHRRSVAEASTRYCNYAKDKFGNELTLVRATALDRVGKTEKALIEDLMEHSEDVYMALVNDFDWTPQDARGTLLHWQGTEVILTMNKPGWRHFLDLRSLGKTGSPHPDMKVVADMAGEILKERGV